MKLTISKNKLLGLIALLLFSLSGCKKVLDLQPFTSFTDASAFIDPDKINLAVNGVYDAAQSGFYLGGQVRGYPFGAASIEQGDMRGEDMANNALFYQITYEATYNNVTANNDFQFQTLYGLINKANLTIDGVADAVSKNIIPAATGNVFIAECRFLRAMAHHELVINFARPYLDGNGSQVGIIYRDFGVNSEAKVAEAAALKREDFPVSLVYTKILEDLDYAEANLPNTSAIKTYRASKAAAIALKMRVKMHKGDWAGVIAEGNKLVPATAPYTSPIGGWKLTATPDGPFANNTSDESIFSIKNDATDNPGVNGALAAMLGDPAINGRGLVRISPIIWSDARWLCNDLRRSSSLARSTSNAVFSNKYRDIATRSDAAPMIRYAEVLLMLAEAEARNAATVSTRALSLLNEVRNRAVTTPADQFTIASFLTKNALISAILFERRVEFLAEGKRWGDIHRLARDADFAPVAGGGIPSKVGTGATNAAWFNCAGGVSITRAVPEIPYSNFRFLWPIPLGEIQQNPNYTQNTGY
jgi:starch-binding outer membrane protein, SusD/RagB family